MLLYQSWSICLRNVPCPAPLLKTWPPSSWRLLCKLGTPPSENICFPHRQDRHGPHVSAGSHSSEREPFPCPHALTPTFITPTPAAAETSSSLWAQAWTSPSPHPLPRPRVVLCQCGHFTAERTAPVLLSPHHSLSRGREGRRGRRDEREGRHGGRGEGGICAAPTKRRLLERWQKHLSCPAFTHSPAVRGPDSFHLPPLLPPTISPRSCLSCVLAFLLIVWSSWTPPLEIPQTVPSPELTLNKS